MLDSLDRINDEFILKLESDMQINPFSDASLDSSTLHDVPFADLDLSQYISLGEQGMSSRSSDSGLSSDNMEM